MSPGPFSPSSLAKSVHDTLAEAYGALPAGANHAVVVEVPAGGTGARMLYVQRAPKGWNVALETVWMGADHVAGKVSLLKAW